MSETKSRMMVVGGRQRKGALDLDEWHAYENAVLLCLDPVTGELETKKEYTSPAEVCADTQPSIVFKAGDLHASQKRLLLCTQTEVLEFDTGDWSQTYYFSHPSFNDLHHACYSDSEQILIANTGLDQVIQLQLNRSQPSESTIRQTWSVGISKTWERFDQATDYRKVSTTKPHEAHPNFVFNFRDQNFVTRFHQQDAVALDEPNEVFPISCGNPHDGIVVDDSVAFTTTDGSLVLFRSTNESATQTIDLNLIQSTGQSLGWCRGLAFENPQVAWVGFSRIRPTWLRKNLSWLKQGFKTKGVYGARPTRVAQYDLANRQLMQEIDLEKHGLNAVFGIYLQNSQVDSL